MIWHLRKNTWTIYILELPYDGAKEMLLPVLGDSTVNVIGISGAVLASICMMFIDTDTSKLLQKKGSSVEGQFV